MAGAGIERLAAWLDRNRDVADEWDERWGDFVVLVGLAMAAAPRLRRADKRVDHLQMRALLAVEWTGSTPVERPIIYVRCIGCNGSRWGADAQPSPVFMVGHGDGCPVDAALTAAGLPDQASRDAARAELAKR